MRKILLAGAVGAALSGLAGMGHNMPPPTLSQVATKPQAVMPRRIVDENRRNQKLKQKLRKFKRLQRLQKYTRAQRKQMQHGPGYTPGKLFKGHRI